MSAEQIADDHHSEHGDLTPMEAINREDDQRDAAFRARSAEILAFLSVDTGKAADAEALQANQVDAWTDRLEDGMVGMAAAIRARRELAEQHREECAILRRRQQALRDGAEALGWKGEP